MTVPKERTRRLTGNANPAKSAVMAIDSEEVLRIARLAHLEFPESETGERLFEEATLQRLAGEIDRILEHVRDLESVAVDGVPPTAHGVPLPPRTRADEAEEPLSPSEALSGAPAQQDNAFAVPKVVE